LQNRPFLCTAPSKQMATGPLHQTATGTDATACPPIPPMAPSSLPNRRFLRGWHPGSHQRQLIRSQGRSWSRLLQQKEPHSPLSAAGRRFFFSSVFCALFFDTLIKKIAIVCEYAEHLECRIYPLPTLSFCTTDRAERSGGVRSTGHVVALLRDRFFTCPDIYGWNASLEIDTTSFRCRHPLASSTPALYMRVHVTPYHMRSTTVLLISVPTRWVTEWSKLTISMVAAVPVADHDPRSCHPRKLMTSTVGGA
jgi:hypothetical protein